MDSVTLGLVLNLHHNRGIQDGCKMVFNKSWNYLKSDWSSTDSLYGNEYEDEPSIERKRHTVDNNYQTTIPQFDPRLDETTGWQGVEPVTAIRVQGNHRKAGQAVPQDGSNKNFEGGDPRLPQRIPEIPHDDDPVWDDPDSRWSKDPKSGSRYYMSGKYEDGKYNPRSKKHFADLKNAKAGTWAAKNTVGDIRNLFTHNNHEKLVYIRGNLDKYGKVHRRDSDEAQEDLAEAFIEHDKDIPRESLVEVPLRDHYLHQTREMGTPDLGPNRRSSEKGRISRWNDKPVPWGESREPTKKIEDMNDDEFQEFQESLYDKTPEEIHELTKGSPMDIAFQLLKGKTRQSTLWGYDPKMVENLLAEDNSNIFIAAKPGNDDMPDDEQNERSDKMLQDLAALKEKHGHFDITSATGRAQWDAEPSFMLTNVPDSARDSINEIAVRYGQESMGISEKGEKGVNYVTPEGEVKDKFSSMEMQEKPEYSTDFPSSQRLAFTGWQEANKANPMHIAFQLLKGWAGGVRGIGNNATDNIYHYPHELDYGSIDEYMGENPDATLGSMVTPYLQGQFTNNPPTNPPAYQSERPTQLQSTVPAPFPQTPEQTKGVQNLINEGFDDYESRDSVRKPHYDSMNNAVRVLSRNLRGNPAYNFTPPGRLRGTKGQGGRSRQMQNMKLRSMLDTPVSQSMAEMNIPKQGISIAAGEPMDIAFQLLKERKSPAAFAHKLEYDKQYQKTPKRVKYREQLNAERRKRGIYGKGGADVSHTQGGKLTLESAHANRARHFKNKGTLRRVKVKK